MFASAVYSNQSELQLMEINAAQCLNDTPKTPRTLGDTLTGKSFRITGINAANRANLIFKLAIKLSVGDYSYTMAHGKDTKKI